MTATMPEGLDGGILELVAEVHREYPQIAPFLEIPEVGAILLEAAASEPPWDGFQLWGEIQQTEYWQTTSAGERALFIDRATDPATVQTGLDEQARVGLDVISQFGIDFDESMWEGMAGLTEQAYIEGWTEERWAEAVAETWFPETPDQLGGTAQATFDDVIRIAGEYGLPMSDKKAMRYAQDVLTGAYTLDNVIADLTEQAISMFPGLEPQLSRGLTVREAADSHLELAAQMLEIDADEIDLRKPMWNRAINTPTEKGPQVMSLTDWQATLMQDKRYGWDSTNNAKRGAMQVADRIREVFGFRS